MVVLVVLEVVFPADLEITLTASIEGSGVAGERWNYRIPGQVFRCPSLKFCGQRPTPPSPSDLSWSPLNPLDAVDADS